MKHFALLLAVTTLCPIHRALAISGNPADSPQAAATPAPAPPQSPFAALIAEYLRQDANGHSPTADEISAMATLQPQPDAASIREAMPYLLRALGNSDTPLRSFALNAIVGLQSPAPVSEAAPPPAAPLDPSIPAPPPAPTPPPGPPVYKPEVAQALAPSIPQIAAHLTSEDDQENRLLTATILGAFTPNPPPSVYPPLIDYLKRDDAIGPVGQAVVTDLLQLGPVSDDTAAAISRYLRRSDQTSDARSNLTDLIAANPNQSRAVNKTLLLYLDSDDASLRARLILSLPQLDLAADLYANTKSLVDQLAVNPAENLQVVTAAKSVAKCWTATKMTSGCPVY